MVFISNLQRETLLLIDNLIEEKKTHEEIIAILIQKDYDLIKEIKNGYMSKTKTKLYKENENSFITLIKRKNGFADWETIKLS